MTNLPLTPSAVPNILKMSLAASSPLLRLKQPGLDSADMDTILDQYNAGQHDLTLTVVAGPQTLIVQVPATISRKEQPAALLQALNHIVPSALRNWERQQKDTVNT